MSASPRATARKQSGASCSAIASASRGWLARSARRGRRDELGDPGGEAGDPHRADEPVRVGGDVGGGGLELREHDVGVADEHLGRAGQPHAAAVALDDGLADLALERGELLGDGGGREVQRVGGRGDGALLGDLAQDAQAAGVDHAGDLTGAERNVYWL